jgi:predicted membrane channel-forming protein YqfA (hemolysin III family)
MSYFIPAESMTLVRRVFSDLMARHLFVLAGSTCHYFAVLFYVAQPRT